MNDCPSRKDSASDQAPHACIHLQEPFSDCYCMNISSFNITRMLAFCNGDYRSCPIFRRSHKKTTTLSAFRSDGNEAGAVDLPSVKE
jgi:hypothetical protein